MKYTVKINLLEETLALAQEIGIFLKPGMIITLEGELGAGKTTFTKGLARGLEIERNVNSPTFTIIKEYEGRLPLYHMDVYRLESSDDAAGFEEYFYGDGVCVIEWASRIKDSLPENRLEVKIYREGETQRVIEFMIIGEEYKFMSEVLKHVCTSH